MRLAIKGRVIPQGSLAIPVRLDRYIEEELVRSDKIQFGRLNKNKIYYVVGLLDNGFDGERIVMRGYGKPSEIECLVKEAMAIGCRIHVRDCGYERRGNR